MPKTMILTSNPGAYFFPWARNQSIHIASPEKTFEYYKQQGDWPKHYEKVILLNGLVPKWLYHPTFVGRDNFYFFLWDPAQCPRYAPDKHTLSALEARYKVYAFQPEDCAALDMQFNSTFYQPPPSMLRPQDTQMPCDILFLGVPKDRMLQLRELHAQFQSAHLKSFFRIGLTRYDEMPEEQAPGWQVSREWVSYNIYLQWVNRSRALLDLYQSIQTGPSLRAMESIFLGKKLITNNLTMRQPYGTAPGYYHPNNIFILGEDNIKSLPEWLERPFVPVSDEVKNYFLMENWIARFV